MQCSVLSGFDRLRTIVLSSGQLRSTAGAAFSTYRQLRSTAGAAFSTFWRLRSSAGAAFLSSRQLRSLAGAAFSSSWQLRSTAGAAFSKAQELRSMLGAAFSSRGGYFRWFYRGNAVPVQRTRGFSASGAAGPETRPNARKRAQTLWSDARELLYRYIFA